VVALEALELDVAVCAKAAEKPIIEKVEALIKLSIKTRRPKRFIFSGLGIGNILIF
jgi:hypothetical protein